MRIKTLVALAVAVTFWGCTGSSQRAAKTPEERGKPPHIIASYAAEKVNPGQSWRVYLRAKDDDGDMDHIVTVLDTPGRPSETSKTRLKGRDHAQFAGYVFLRTPSDINRFGGFPKSTLTTFIRDKQGNKSNEVKLPLSFDNQAKQIVPAEWQEAADNKLGAIMIDFGRVEQSQASGGAF
jgi:hypothetical protein